MLEDGLAGGLDDLGSGFDAVSQPLLVGKERHDPVGEAVGSGSGVSTEGGNHKSTWVANTHSILSIVALSIYPPRYPDLCWLSVA